MKLIIKASDVKKRIEDGWELWSINEDSMPGRWEVRRGKETVRVCWDAIISLRRNLLPWFDENTISKSHGNTWVYSYNQKSILNLF